MSGHETQDYRLMRGSGIYPRCIVTGCTYRALDNGRCERHTRGSGGRKAPSPRQLMGAADVLRRFAGSRELTSTEDASVQFAADLIGMAALAQESRNV